ncbi:MAG: autotransporter outer membrane beta-barrel domain-containing protein [Candidatus Rhabdochlamydia sp.]
MKQTMMILTMSGILGTCALNAYTGHTVLIKDTADGKNIFMLQTSKRDRLYWGPDVFWSDESPNIKGIRIEGDSIFYGLRAGYDFLRPNSMYAGVDALYAVGRTHLTAETGQTELYKDKITGTIGRGELRLGYNFVGEDKLYFSPFVGVGGYHSRSVKSIHFVQNWLYLTMGMKVDYEITPKINAGLNVKGMSALYLEQSIEKNAVSAERHDNSNALGYEVSLPLTMRFGKSCNWDFRLEPYYIKLNSQSNANVAGAQFTFSNRF